MLLPTWFAYLFNSFGSRWYAWGEKDFFTCLFYILEGTNYKTCVISYGFTSLFFDLKRTVKKRVHFIANLYIRFHLACLITFEHLTLILLTWRKWWAPNNASKEQMGFNSGFKGLICGSRFNRRVQMLLCTLLVPAFRSPGCFSFFFFVFCQRCVWHTDSWGAKQQVLRLKISNKSFGTR
jgi:hypothetical protein